MVLIQIKYMMNMELIHLDSLTTNSAPGINYNYVQKTKTSWNFINKIWNSARFVLMNIDKSMNMNI